MDLKKASFQILRLSFPVKAHFYNGFLHMGWLSFLSLTVGPMDFPRKEDGKVPFLEGYNVFPFCLAIERDITRFTPIFGHIETCSTSVKPSVSVPSAMSWMSI